MNRLNELEIRAARRRVVAAAGMLVSGQSSFIDGVRELDGLQYEVSNQDHDPDFSVFKAIASQADHLPAFSARDLCSANWLTHCDQEANELETFYCADVKVACAQLIARFSVNL